MYACKLYLDERELGTVRWAETDRETVSVWVDCPFEADVIYRVVIEGEAGESLPLGVMMPERSRFVLRKTLPREKAAFLLAPEAKLRGRVLRARPGERVEIGRLPFGVRELKAMNEVAYITDPLLVRCLSEEGEVLYGMAGEELFIFFPFTPGGETPFTPFLSIAAPVEVDRKSYGVIKVSKNGAISSAEEG